LFTDSDIGRNEYGENPKGRNSVLYYTEHRLKL
jgi:hypothetical protein